MLNRLFFKLAYKGPVKLDCFGLIKQKCQSQSVMVGACPSQCRCELGSQLSNWGWRKEAEELGFCYR